MFSYHYRSVHAAAEWALKNLTPQVADNVRAPLARMPQRILILKFGGMGEAVLARSIVEHLRTRHPGIEIEFLVDSRTRGVMTCPGRNHSTSYEPRRDGVLRAVRTIAAIRARNYEVAVDFEQTSLLTAAFLRAAGIPVRVGFAPPGDNPRRFFLTHPIELRETESMWSGMVLMARVLDPSLPSHLSVLPLPVSPDDTRNVDNWWQHNVPAATSRVVAMHLGVGPRAQYRRWPVDQFATVAQEIRLRVPDVMIALTGDVSEGDLARQFAAMYEGPAAYALEFGSVERTAALLSRCDLLISSDTGVMHLGAAMGTPTVGIFGASNPVYWAPVGPRATFVHATRRSCSPCINSYRRLIPPTCTAPTYAACMSDVSVSQVVKAARSVVRDDWLGPSRPSGHTRADANVAALRGDT
jgi:ADP-heptose:LPS heptosyltransferase